MNECGKIIPVVPFKEFESEKQFENIRTSLNNTDQKWLENFKSKSQKVMDSVFFQKDRFEVIIDVRGYKPDEIKCKISPAIIEILAEKDDEEQHLGATTNRVTTLSRRYELPQHVNANCGSCAMSSDGILVVCAPWCGGK